MLRKATIGPPGLCDLSGLADPLCQGLVPISITSDLRHYSRCLPRTGTRPQGTKLEDALIRVQDEDSSD